MKKQTTKASDIKRAWHLVDLKDKVLGRVATDIAVILMGKKKPYFVRNLDCGDYVVAINASLVKVTGRKEKQKTYYSYSGYPGGLRQEKLETLRQRKPAFVIEHAVKGMLPQNRLRDTMLSRLFVFQNETHRFSDKFRADKAKEEAK